MTQGGSGFARIVVAIVAEEDNLAANFLLQSPGGLDFRDKVTSREEPARLLAEADDRFGIHWR
jgi:hypothetical protein